MSADAGRSGPAPGPGEILALSRSLDAYPDPVALYAACTDGGARADTLLLESADLVAKSAEQSLVMTRAALRLTCRGREVEVRALSANGAGALGWIAERLRARAELRTEEDALTASFPPAPHDASEDTRLAAPAPLDAVRAAILGVRVLGGPPVAPLCLGTFAYDLLGVYERLPAAAHNPTGWPDFELWVAEELVVIQHRARRTTILRYVLGGPRAAAAYHDAERALGDLVETCRRIDTVVPAKAVTQRDVEPLDPRLRGNDEAVPDLDDAASPELVTQLKTHIVKGDVFQIVASRSFSAPCPDPLAAYTRLRALNPSPYMFFLHGAAGVLFGASPESALTVRRDPTGARRVAISPIAGTRPRGFDADLDTRIEAELRLDEKEIAEHMMLVDLARNDVARVSKPGTRAVTRLLDVVRYSHVMHLVSLVSGELRAELDALHAYVATMNMGTLTGAPKLEAATLLRRYEPARRGPYGGAVGYLTADGELDTCIVIRSAHVAGGVARVRAGAGIVYDSDPAAEATETRRKADAVLAAIAGRVS